MKSPTINMSGLNAEQKIAVMEWLNASVEVRPYEWGVQNAELQLEQLRESLAEAKAEEEKARELALALVPNLAERIRHDISQGVSTEQKLRED